MGLDETGLKEKSVCHAVEMTINQPKRRKALKIRKILENVEVNI
jgi:hypothetical protein